MTRSLTNKVLLVGWDAADWKIITPLMDAGKMPNLQKFADSGVVGNLSTLYPVLSPMLWTSIATGKRASKHGIHGFAEPDPETGGVRPVTSLGRKTRAIWNMLNLRGLRSNVVGWWPSFPAEPVNGVMVSNRYQQAVGPLNEPWPMPAGTVHPERLRRSLEELRVHPGELTGDQLLPFVPGAADIDPQKDGRLQGIAKILAECASVHSAATGIMQLEDWDFMAVYLDAIDHFSHGFMKYHPPRLPWIAEQDFEHYRHVIETAYRFHDLMLGTLMALAGEDTTVIVVSDHGFHSDHLRPRELPNEPAGPAEEHRPFGIFAAYGPGIRKDELVFGASLLDITPTILTLFGLPVGRDMDGKPLLGALQGAAPDWIDSWDDLEGDDGSHPPEMNADVLDAHESLQQLVDLGYIEEPDEDRQTTVRHTVRELRYNLGRDLFGARRYHEAIPVFEELWEEFPEESRFGLKLFDCRLGLKQTGQAAEVLDRIVDRKQHYSRHAAEKLQQKLQQYEADGRQAGELDSRELRTLQKLQRSASTNEASLAYLRARLFHAQGEHTAALAELDKADAIQLHNHPPLLQTRGEILMATGRWSEASRVYRMLLDLDPVNPGAQIGLCRCHLAVRGQEQQALERAMACLGLAYHNPRAHFLCGVALQRLGRIRDAEKSFRTAVSQSPVFPAAHRRLARLYRLALGDAERANEHALLARAGRQRLAAFRSGAVTEPPAEGELDTDAVASLRDLGNDEDPGPLSDEAIVVVSGLPRSGTSMMMQMLEAGGLPVFTDEDRQADSDNPRGYYEHRKVRATKRDKSWVAEARGKAVKVIAQLLPELAEGEEYRAIFMERPLKNIIASQSRMLERLGKRGGCLSDHRLAETYLGQVDAVRKDLAENSIRLQVMSVDYHQALNDPAAVAARVNAFLGGRLDEHAMRNVIDQSLCRQRN